MLLKRCRTRRLVSLASFATVVLLVGYYSHLPTLLWQKATPWTSVLSHVLGLSTNKDRQPVDEPDLELVVAATKGENTTWINEYLPDWRTKVYIVDDPQANFTVPQNKGHEAMVILT